MSLLLLFKPRRHGVVTPPPDLPLPTPGRTARHKPIAPPRVERFFAGTARILLRSYQPELLLVPTAKGGTVRLSAGLAEWEQRLESSAKHDPKEVSYRAARDDRDFDELVQTAYLLTR